jgi:hypothetical protein
MRRSYRRQTSAPGLVPDGPFCIAVSVLVDAGLPAPLDLAQKRSPAYSLCQGSGTGFSPTRHCLSDATASDARGFSQPLRNWEIAQGHLKGCRGTVDPRTWGGLRGLHPLPKGHQSPLPAPPGPPRVTLLVQVKTHASRAPAPTPVALAGGIHPHKAILPRIQFCLFQ